MKPKLYISGPMSGFVNHNHAAFNAAADRLTYYGYQVINPAKNGLDKHSTWVEHMRRDITLLMECDSIYMLRGHELSKGAGIELGLARSLHMPIFYQGQDDEKLLLLSPFKQGMVVHQIQTTVLETTIY
jgi:hypothetical protein